jgi:cyclic beta-1,2-glucan synthetase
VISYAAEWLLDNYYLVEQTFRLIREDLPAGYYRQLPKLISGLREGYPRIYELACEIISHDLAQVELDRLHRFLMAYQRDVPLTMGEIWAVPIFVRFGLLAAMTEAFEQILGLPERIEDSLLPTLPPPSEVSRDEIVANSFSSLRRLAVQDWKVFFESTSLVERIFVQDPADIYTIMDFDTRDRYRKEVEELSMANGLEEVEIARACIDLSKAAAESEAETSLNRFEDFAENPHELPWTELHAHRQEHIGYYLIDSGREMLENTLQIRAPLRVRARRWLFNRPEFVYLGSITLISLILLSAGISYLSVFGTEPIELALFLLLGLVPGVTVAVSIVNLLVTRFVPPRVLPKLDLSKGLPATCRTMVVIPSLITNEKEVNSLLGQLEQHFLRNPDPNLSFALLTDFADAPTEKTPEDDELVREAINGIRQLNGRYSFGLTSPFYLFHRKRLWNPSEGVWMGWERKRGKLKELNALIMGSRETSFYVQEGDTRHLHQIRYVITLDADTVLPLGGADRLIGTMAHPLNRPLIDSRDGKVIAGYSLLQPRTEVKPVSANQTWFTRVYAGDTGLDLYTLAVSDVYQDLFGEGIYVGKGIYDVRAFERSLMGKVPENALLSHDLFEGIHGRVGLVTDIVLYEDFPPTYLSYLHRLHRWVRGDWQLFPWLLPRVPCEDGKKVWNWLPLIDQWKIADNLRRSLLAPSILTLLLSAWIWLPGSPLVWTIAFLLVPAVPLLSSLLNWVWEQSSDRTKIGVIRSIRSDFYRWVLGIALIPVEALVTLDAILSTFVRIMITRRNLLQWVPAARTNRLLGKSRLSGAEYQQLGVASFFSAGTGVLVGLVNPSGFLTGLPVLLTWLVSPVIANRISRPLIDQVQPLSESQTRRLQSLARRTWLFFEQFIGPEDNWLPPDHFQESPLGQIAHRTSPTNIGLMLTSTLAAYDLGYIDLLNFSARFDATLDSLNKLEKYRGHFLNWYDTRSLESLPPRYVSTVDSGNLAACFIILKKGCQSIPSAPVLHWRRWRGFHDTLGMLAEGVVELGQGDFQEAIQPLLDFISEIQMQVMGMRDNPSAWTDLLSDLLTRKWPEIDRQLIHLIEQSGSQMDSESLGNLRIYTQRAHHHLYGMQREVDLLFPWISSFSNPPAFLSSVEAPQEVQAFWQRLQEVLPTSLSVQDINPGCSKGEEILDDLRIFLSDEAKRTPGTQISDTIYWVDQLFEKLTQARLSANSLIARLNEVIRYLEILVQSMDFGFLYEPDRQVFHIGYNLDTGRLDPNYYDLLASEARIASLVAIGKRDIPPSHWLHLSRPFTNVNGSNALLSWSGTMFEYLMPPLMVQHYPRTMLSQSIIAATDYQIQYGKEKNIPWGISESGFYAFDANQNYQYRAFGVPGLGFKRGLGEDLVVAPYASMLALSIRPQALMENIDLLSTLGMQGTYGFYEAIDFTPSRVPLGKEAAIVKSFMAHHQGMILLALANHFSQGIMVKRFHEDSQIQSVELLLQEMVPQEIVTQEPHSEEARATRPFRAQVSVTGWHAPVFSAVPQMNILSNGRFHTFISSSGGGYSRWEGLDLTRWRADPTLDSYGTWIYIQDQENGDLWSAGYQPTATKPDSQEVFFYPHMVEFRRRDGEISTTMEVTVPPQIDIEIRTVTLMNQGDRPRRFRISSYAEVILSAQATDARHPAFNKLFIESEYLPDLDALLFRRRPRSKKESPLYLVHSLVTDEELQGSPAEIAYESDRYRFLGRGNTVRSPAAFREDGEWLSRTTGATLDPVMVLGQEITVDPHRSVSLAFLTVAGESRKAAQALVSRYRNWPAIHRAFELARAHIEVDMRQLGLLSSDLENLQRLISGLLLPHKALRASPEVIQANKKGQPGLWGFAISGDYPILLIEIDSQEDLSRLGEILRMHAYWRTRDIKIDLVILNSRETGYAQELMNQVRRLISRLGSDFWVNRRGGIFLLLADQMTFDDLVLLKTVARVILRKERGPLGNQLKELLEMPDLLPPFNPTLAGEIDEATPPLDRPADLKFDNGIGGFSEDGREYVIYLQPELWTPAPWVNVIANEQFGFLVSEGGSGYSWAINSGENRLTSWSNDPVSDRPGEAVYLRDEETGLVWSSTPLPARDGFPYLIRHGAGYSIFEHYSNGLKQSTRMFVPKEEPVKIVQLHLENTWNRVRRMTVTYYAEWVLGINHESSGQFIVPEFDTASQALLARNRNNEEFGERVAFLTSDREVHGLTADRKEFLGHLGSYVQPSGLGRIGLSGRVEAGDDPCGALQIHLDIHPGETVEVHFLIGEGNNREHALELVNLYRQPEMVAHAWKEVTGFWDELLGTVRVETPEPGMDLLLNRWLLYQALSCRIWGRSAFYQSSGAYGYRDQLQDVMSLVFSAPEIAREHLLRAARHQFEAGDVLHWWHPPSGRGVRTRFSDDLVWLPFVTEHYVSTTGDDSVLDELIPFRMGSPLEPEEEERYGFYPETKETYTLYEHCRRALEKGSTFGRNNLPLMGGGDWNDGMNRVGIGGEGESVWLAWFLIGSLQGFARICERRGDESLAARFRGWAEKYRQAIEANAWDGEWYLRAFYDDGTPLGSSQNRECQIDSLSQSWAVLTGAGAPERSRQGMQAVAEQLIRYDDRLILLFTPPFDKTPRDPGYIRGYLPGIRENGGQYTHAALWTIWAYAELGMGDFAESLFRLINPIYQSDSPEGAGRYRVEPYVIAADVYGVPPHTGRGGWTWYTGSSGWTYRLGVEAILGLSLESGALKIDPCIPKSWPGFRLDYRHGSSLYRIEVNNPEGVNQGVKQVILDGNPIEEKRIQLVDDGGTHEVLVLMG